ncbi:MAG TPA: thiolase domain-containing protein [Candidatus Saccharimonadales bacterium]|nr:thiolase domain-containing protein [Candidatus Saccharimonadales bacterium]
MKVVVSGTGITNFGELWNRSLTDLAQEAINLAIKDAKISPEKIDAIFVGNMLAGNLSTQNHLGPTIASLLNLNCPAFSIESACASGGMATNLAYESIKSGKYQNVLIVGVEKMTDDPTDKVTLGLMGAASENERKMGLTFPGLYALLANVHMQKFKTTRKQLSMVAVKNHHNGSINPIAHFQNKISLEKAMQSPQIASPLNLFDCSPISDGAAAIVLSAKRDTSNDVAIVASAVATDQVELAKRVNLSELLATKIAAKNAYNQAQITPKDIDLAEVHDCFTIAEILALEDLGFEKKGQGGKFTQSGATELSGKLPINTSGGLKACGHPVGATGVKQIIEITKQLQNKAEKRQIKGAKIGLTHNVGGSGATAVVHILQI